MTDPVLRRDELLAGRAVGDLSFDEDVELERLLSEHPTDPGDADAFERTAAVLHLALCADEGAAMPTGLADRIAARLADEMSAG